VKALNRYGSIAPISKKLNTIGSVIATSAKPRGNPCLALSGFSRVQRLTLVTKPPKRESPTRAAEPIANPFPMAAVVLPAASKASVYSLISGPNSDISAIPPALSEIGPYPSIAREMGRLLSIPSAPRATP
jgi:outer membrane biosynthesis protein TonB